MVSSAFWAPGVEKVQPVMHCSPTGPRPCNLWVQRGIVAACVVCEHANNSRVTVMWSQWRCSNSRLLVWWGNRPVKESGAVQIAATLCRVAMDVYEGQCDKVCVLNVLNVLVGGVACRCVAQDL